MKKNTNGFSIIELMIVVAIIGILTIIAIPSYHHYLKRARFTEVITATLPFKTAIWLALQQGEAIDNLQAGSFGIPMSPKATKHLESITVSKGKITAIGTSELDNATYILKLDEDATQWLIEGSCLEKGFCHS